MRQKKLWFRMSRILGVLAIILMLPPGAGAASKYRILHYFPGHGTTDGEQPAAGLIFDAAGNLYGTTSGGGPTGGTVFKMTRNVDGSWKETVIDGFTGNDDGGNPEASLIFDAVGSLYGTTQWGGSGCSFGCGTVFKLTPNSNGTWTESLPYRFTGESDGASPVAALIFDKAGNLYGTTSEGGNLTCNAPFGCGVVFKLMPNSDGSWTESVLYAFSGLADGRAPFASLIFDAAGNLYGTTAAGGDILNQCPTLSVPGCGTVFKLTPNSDGSWTESVLYAFSGLADGGAPFAGVIFDKAGNLYGTTYEGGSQDGTVFKLTPNSDGSWTESVLHTFLGISAAGPVAGLIFDAAGNLYGTTYYPTQNGIGAIFKMAPRSGGGWAYSVLHIFLAKPAASPKSGLVFDKAGNLYGTTWRCTSRSSCGVVFEITP